MLCCCQSLLVRVVEVDGSRPEVIGLEIAQRCDFECCQTALTLVMIFWLLFDESALVPFPLSNGLILSDYKDKASPCPVYFCELSGMESPNLLFEHSVTFSLGFLNWF